MIGNNRFTAKQKDILQRVNPGAFIPVLNQIQGTNLFILDNNAIGFMFICNPSPGIFDNQKDLLSELYKLDFPTDTVAQVTMSALPDLIMPLSYWAALRGGRMTGTDKEQSDALNAYQLEYLVRSQYEPLKPNYDNLTLRDFQVWFSFSIPIKGVLPTSYEHKKIMALYREVNAKLSSMSLSPFAAEAEHWLYCVDKILNPGDAVRWSDGEVNAKTTRPLNEQINVPGRKYDIDSEYLSSTTSNNNKTEQRFFKHLSVTKMPEYVQFGVIHELIVNWMTGRKTVFNPFMITLTVQFPKQEKITNQMVRYKAITNKQAGIPLVVTFCPRLKEMDDDYMALTREIEDGSKLLNAYLSFTVMGNDPDDVRDAAEQMKSFYSESRVNLTEDNFILLGALLSQLPMCNDATTIRDLDRSDVFTNTGLAHLTPIFGPWKGNTNNPVLTFVSREGQLVCIDLFKTSASFNACFGATSGAGKSFTAGYIINSYLGAGPRLNPITHFMTALKYLKNDSYAANDDSADGAQVFVVDVGRSYQGIASQYSSSQFIDFGQEPTFTLNPFAFMTDIATSEMVANESENSDKSDAVAQTIMVLNQLKMMASESGNITDLQQAVMIELICAEYEESQKNGSTGSPTGFAKRCIQYGENNNEKSIRNIGIQLGPWCENGIYGKRFTDKLPPIDFNARFIVLELEELKGTPHLQTVVLMSIIQAAQHAMFIKKDGRRRLFILDEAWEYIKPDTDSGTHANNAFFAKFLETAWRRFRKTNCAGICITQSFEDYFTSSVGRALANNSPWKFILKQEKEAIESMKENKYFSTSDAEYERMKNITTKKGVYSEMMVRFENVQEICRLYVDRKMELCLTTDAKDRGRIWHLQREGYSYAQAIEKIYQEELKSKSVKIA